MNIPVSDVCLNSFIQKVRSFTTKIAPKAWNGGQAPVSEDMICCSWSKSVHGCGGQFSEYVITRKDFTSLTLFSTAQEMSMSRWFWGTMSDLTKISCCFFTHTGYWILLSLTLQMPGSLIMLVIWNHDLNNCIFNPLPRYHLGNILPPSAQ